jgi:ribosome-associated protein
MDIKKLQAVVVDALEDVKGQDIVVYDTTHLTSLFDRIAIASGTSNRQTKALAASVRDKVKQNGGEILSLEGEDTGEWVLVDLGDMIVHIMQPAIRAYYRLEEIWGDKQVKFGAAVRKTAAKKAAATDEEAPKKTARRGTLKSGADGEAPAAKKVAAKKTAARKVAAKKTAARKTPVGKTVKVASSKSATAAKKTAAKRAKAA